MEKYFYLGTKKEVFKRMSNLLRVIKAEPLQFEGKPMTDNNTFKIQSGKVYVSVDQLCEIFKFDKSFFASDSMLDLMNKTQKEIGEFPIKQFSIKK